MKRTFAVLTAALCLSFVSQLRAEDFDRSYTDIATWKNKASSDVALGISSISAIYATQGLVNAHEHWFNPMPPSSTSILDLRITTASLINGATNIPRSSIKPVRGYPTALFVREWFESQVGTVTLPSTMTLSGFDAKGATTCFSMLVSTDIRVTSTTFVSISSISFNVLSSSQSLMINDSVMHIVMGSSMSVVTVSGAPFPNIRNGSARYGLSNEIENPGDVYKVMENGVDISSASIEPVFDTIQFTTPETNPSTVWSSTMTGNTYDVWYRVKKSPPNRIHPYINQTP